MHLLTVQLVLNVDERTWYTANDGTDIESSQFE
jgi:hypothetical protein